MKWVLRLVETGTDGQSRSSDVMAISRPDGLGDLAYLGLTLVEAKQLFAHVQRDVVAAQAGNHAMYRPDCQSCGGRCHVKDWRSHRIATVCGEVRLKLPRFLCAGCDRGETGVGWPPHRRSTRELNQLRARLSALLPYRVKADVRLYLMPISAGKSPETLRSHTLQVGKQLGDAAAGGGKYVDRQPCSDDGEGGDRRRGRTSALAHLERQGKECPAQHQAAPQGHACLQRGAQPGREGRGVS